MDKLTTYRVVREHVGDKPYAEGDEREAVANEVAHLIPHVLVPIEGKGEAAPLNKAEGAAPANKASTGRKAKT